jgi:hypothetical protein
MISGDLCNESLEVENASEVNEESGPVREAYLWFVFVGGPVLHVSIYPSDLGNIHS